MARPRPKSLTEQADACEFFARRLTEMTLSEREQAVLDGMFEAALTIRWLASNQRFVDRVKREIDASQKAHDFRRRSGG